MAKIDLTQQVQGVLPVSNGGTGGVFPPKFSDRIIPTGTQNGLNLIFTLPEVPFPVFSLTLFKNGSLLDQTVDYTIAGNTVTYTVAPILSDVMRAWYRSAQTLLSLTDALMMTDNFVAAYRQLLTDTMTMTDHVVVTRYVARLLSDTMTMSDQIVTGTGFIESLSMTDSFRMFIPQLQLSDTLTQSDFFRIYVNKWLFTDAMVLSDVVAIFMSNWLFLDTMTEKDYISIQMPPNKLSDQMPAMMDGISIAY